MGDGRASSAAPITNRCAGYHPAPQGRMVGLRCDKTKKGLNLVQVDATENPNSPFFASSAAFIFYAAV